MIIDSHCHLLHSKSEKTVPDIISDAKKIAMDWWRSLHTQDLKDWVEVK